MGNATGRIRDESHMNLGGRAILTGQDTGCVAKFLSGPFHSILSFKNISTSIERRFIQKSF
jgi:hypothetical protein